MMIAVKPGRRLFVDVENLGLVPDGTTMREKPVLLLVHGGPGGDHLGYKPAFARLADVAQIVYFDLRGHGRSDRAPMAEWTIDTFADDLVRLCDALGVEKPIVHGQSFGGFVVQRYLARHPDHPRAAILSSTTHHEGTESVVAMFEKLGGRDAADAARAVWTDPDEATWERFAAVCLPLYNPPAPANGYPRGKVSIDLDVCFHFWRGERRTMQLLPGLANVRCPVLVLAGGLDPVCPVDDARAIAAAIPAPWSRLVVFDRAGHGVWRDEPDAAFATMRDFIASSTLETDHA